jgi:hypothetical protein
MPKKHAATLKNLPHNGGIRRREQRNNPSADSMCPHAEYLPKG